LEQLPRAKLAVLVQLSNPDAKQVIERNLNDGLPVVLNGLAAHEKWPAPNFALTHTKHTNVLGHKSGLGWR